VCSSEQSTCSHVTISHAIRNSEIVAIAERDFKQLFPSLTVSSCVFIDFCLDVHGMRCYRDIIPERIVARDYEDSSHSEITTRNENPAR